MYYIICLFYVLHEWDFKGSASIYLPPLPKFLPLRATTDEPVFCSSTQSWFLGQALNVPLSEISLRMTFARNAWKHNRTWRSRVRVVWSAIAVAFIK